MGEVGREVRRLREARGWNQAKLAVEAGMAPSAVNQIENGKRSPSAASLTKLAGALGVEVRDLFPLGQATLPDVFSRGERDPEAISEQKQAQLQRQFEEAIRREFAGEKPLTTIEDTDETITFRVYYVRLLNERNRLLQKVRELERQNAELAEQLEKANVG